MAQHEDPGLEITPRRTEAAAHLRRQLASVASTIPVLLVGALVGALAGYLLASEQPRAYEATTTLVVGPSLGSSAVSSDRLLAAQQYVSTYAQLATTRPLLERAAARAGSVAEGIDLAEAISVETSGATTLFRIVGRAADPSVASDITNAVAEELVFVSPALLEADLNAQQTIDQELAFAVTRLEALRTESDTLAAITSPTTATRDRLAELQDEIRATVVAYTDLLPLASGNAPTLLSVVEPAVPPDSSVAPRPLLAAMLGAMLGLLAAAVVVYGPRLIDDRIRSSGDATEATGLAVIGTIPRGGRLRGRADYRTAVATAPQSAIADAYRSLRWSLELAAGGQPTRALLVTSAHRPAGKTAVAVNLALAYARSGRTVLLVDADLRSPRVHDALSLSNSRGLATLLDSGPDTGPVEIHAVGQTGRLGVMTAGSVHDSPADLLGSKQMRSVLEQMKGRSDVVIFDSAPMSTGSDATILSAIVDATLVVAEAGRSRRDELHDGVEALMNAGATLLGVVLVTVPRWSSSVPVVSQVPQPPTHGTVTTDTTAQQPRPYATRGDEPSAANKVADPPK